MYYLGCNQIICIGAPHLCSSVTETLCSNDTETFSYSNQGKKLIKIALHCSREMRAKSTWRARELLYLLSTVYLVSIYYY